MNWRPAYVALGSNLSDPRRQVETAIRKLAELPESRLVLWSRLWRSAPMGPRDQPDFVNAVAGLLTRLEPGALLGELRALERRMGRSEPVVRWGPRLIDLDLLMVGDHHCDQPGLRLPHPGLPRRNFVLYPLAEIAPTLWVPDEGRVQTLLGRIRDDGLEPLIARDSGD